MWLDRIPTTTVTSYPHSVLSELFKSSISWKEGMVSSEPKEEEEAEEEKDYYAILEVPRTAKESEIKRAYRNLAKVYHPDKCQLPEAAQRFQDIGEAYDVLTDKERRAVYDQYGYNGLRETVEEEANGKQDARETFDNVFARNNPFASFGFGDQLPFTARLRKPQAQNKPASIIRPLNCTLEELFHGCLKKVSVTRKRIFRPENDEPRLIDESTILTIQVQPGWRAGTKITFPNEADATTDGLPPADLIFEVHELRHKLFKREGTNLIYTTDILLGDALAGTVLNVPTLDQRTIQISIPEVISPSYSKIIKNEGMPLSKTPNLRGNLILHFSLLFPQYLTEAQRALLRKVLHAAHHNPPPASSSSSSSSKSS